MRMYTCEEIHPRRLRDFPSRAVPKKGKKGLNLGMYTRPEAVLAVGEGIDFPICLGVRTMDILSSLTISLGMDQKIHPSCE